MRREGLFVFEQTETENTPARETPALQTIRELGQTGTPTGGPLEEMPFHCLTIIGQIEGHLCLLYTSRCV